MKRDQDRLLHFAPLQGETAEQVIEAELRKTLATLVYRRSENEVLVRSSAVLQALLDIRSGWRFLARPALLLPESWRDAVYKLVAKNRYRFFPKNDCPLPSAEERQKLLP